MMFSTLKKVVSLVLVTTIFLVPMQTQAATTNYQPQTQQEFIAYLMGILVQLQAQLAAQQKLEASTPTRVTTTRSTPNPHFVIVNTLAPVSLGRSIVTLRGEVDKGSSKTLDVWVQYGSGSNLNYNKSAPTITKSSRQTIDIIVDELRSNTTYSYRFVTEDERGYRHYGDVRTFTTVDSAETQSFSGRPTVETEGAEKINSTGATVSGFISMNNYISGNAFIVYGPNWRDLDDVTDYDSYKEIPVIYGGMNKRSANSKFTGRNTVKVSLSGLGRATKYYYRACIEYSSRNDGINPSVRCGEVESFVTLN